MARIVRPSKKEKNLRGKPKRSAVGEGGYILHCILVKFILLITIYELADFFLCACTYTYLKCAYVLILILLDFTARTPPPPQH